MLEWMVQYEKPCVAVIFLLTIAAFCIGVLDSIRRDGE